MADDSYGMGIPLPADSTLIHQYPAIARRMGERIAQILAGDIMPDGLSKLAAEQIRAQLAKADILTGDDPRSPRISSTQDLLFAVHDSSGQQTWIGANSRDGGPSDWALHLLREALGIGTVDADGYLFALTDSQRNLTDLTIRATDGQLADFVIDRLRPRILEGFTAPAPVPTSQQRTYADTKWKTGSEIFPVHADSSRIVGWGSSSMEGIVQQFRKMAEDFGASYYDGGKSAEAAQHIAARIGSVPALLTVAGGRIPASGTVTVTASNVWTSPSLKTFAGTLSGIRGTLSYDSASASYMFTRTTAGTARDVAAGTPFIPDAISYRDAVTLLWMGKNNFGNTDNGVEKTVISLTDATFDWLAPLAKRCIVMGHFSDTGTPAVSVKREQILATNAAHRARYGNLYFDVYDYLTGPQLWTDTGITPTATDLAEQALGNKPPSVSSDPGHFNSAGFIAVRDRLKKHITGTLGWY